MLAVEAKHFKARSWQKLATLAPKESQKVCQNRENIIKMAPKMGSKSIKSKVASRMRFWSVYERPKGGHPNVATAHFGSHFWSIFDEKSQKAARRF